METPLHKTFIHISYVAVASEQVLRPVADRASLVSLYHILIDKQEGLDSRRVFCSKEHDCS